ncbi:ketopantoate reductase family protein [Planctomicrobium sp. SH668]|uniref:ketopantoate reductase family protein n=1 Tax=Planctomicrobium sp. SH668 TaxID=3448126 RepID=UPI003F5BD173
MRILILGAGAVGGYFGARLIASGKDVTFLVRPARAQLIAEYGLRISSPSGGDLHLPEVKTVVASKLEGQFDLVIVTCKSYDLESSMKDIAPAIGPGTIILPLLNGLQHVEILEQRFPAATVLGGCCFISTRVEADHSITHLSDVHRITFGAKSSADEQAARRTFFALCESEFEVINSENILQEMWEKWIFIASMAGLTCLMRGTIGDVVVSGGAWLSKSLLDECSEIAGQNGYQPRPAAYDFALGHLTKANSPIAASMLGDVERNSSTEAQHVLFDLLARGKGTDESAHPLLRLAWLHLESYRNRRLREFA